MKKEFLILAIALGPHWQRKALGVIGVYLAILAASYLTGCNVAMEAETDTDSEYSTLADESASDEYVEPVDDCEQDVDALLAEVEQLKSENEQLHYETSVAYQAVRDAEQIASVAEQKYAAVLDEFRALQTLVMENQCAVWER